MPIYHFHLDDGASHDQFESMDLPDMEAARRQAAAFLDTLLHGTDTRLRAGDILRMRVTQETGRVCFSLQFTAVGAAAGGIAAYRERAEQAFPKLTPTA